MLKFLGIGSAFNVELGNNNAYIKDGNTLFLIDCGSTGFEKIKSNNLLNGVEQVIVLITHTHPDHIGSLGDLIFYTYYAMQPMFTSKIKIISGVEHSIINYLDAVGIKPELYEFEHIIDKKHLDFTVSAIEPVKVEHAAELESCFGYFLTIDGKRIYYSGDSNMIPEVILDDLKMGKIERLYQDTCKADYPGNVHLSLNELCELIPEEYREKVFTMHFDDGLAWNPEELWDLGFETVDVGLNF